MLDDYIVTRSIRKRRLVGLPLLGPYAFMAHPEAGRERRALSAFLQVAVAVVPTGTTVSDCLVRSGILEHATYRLIQEKFATNWSTLDTLRG